jgi:hypothetical protein
MIYVKISVSDGGILNSYGKLPAQTMIQSQSKNKNQRIAKTKWITPLEMVNLCS